jgi:hypothetical protein
VRLTERGKRNPLVVLASRYKVSREKTRDMIHRARVLGFLPRGTAGRAGGQLTERGKQEQSTPKERD